MQVSEVPAAEGPAPCPVQKEQLQPRGWALEPSSCQRHSRVSKWHWGWAVGLPPVPRSHGAGLAAGRLGTAGTVEASGAACRKLGSGWWCWG